MTHSKRQGFTILEIAVVVAIIGLVLGSVFGGKRMLQQSRLQAVISDLTKVKSAVDTFKLTYGGLPGDFVEATNQWGGSTTNGDSNGFIDGTEPFAAWQQLSLAGLIDGSFSGAGPTNCVAGTNCPAAKLENSTLSLFSIGSITSPSAGTWWPGNYGTVVMLGQSGSAFNSLSPIMSPRDAEAIDKKLDDGKPATGKIFVARSIAGLMAAGGCVTDIAGTTAVTLTTSYVRSSNVANSCNLGFKID